MTPPSPVAEEASHTTRATPKDRQEIVLASREKFVRRNTWQWVGPVLAGQTISDRDVTNMTRSRRLPISKGCLVDPQQDVDGVTHEDGKG